MNKQQALTTIVRAIKKPAHMAEDREYRETIALFHHPISTESVADHMMINFVGFSSDSIYPLLFHALTATPPIVQLIFWLCQQTDNPGQHQIFAEIKTEYETFICSGMTDFSGAGSSAYREMEAVFEFLADVYGIQVKRIEVLPGGDDNAWDHINKAAKEQLAEIEE